MYLQTRGYRTVIAHNGNEALTLAHLMHPDLVLMDLQMPVMDGLEAIRNLRKENDEQLAAVPVIALATLAMPTDRTRSMETGTFRPGRPRGIKTAVVRCELAPFLG